MAMSTSVYIHVHHPFMNPQNGPSARLNQITYPPSCGIAALSSAVVSASGRAQMNGRTAMRKSASACPHEIKESYNPNIPPLTQQKTADASVSVPSARWSKDRGTARLYPKESSPLPVRLRSSMD